MTVYQIKALRYLRRHGPAYGTSAKQSTSNLNARVAGSLRRLGLVEVDHEGVGSHATRWRLTARGREEVVDG